MTELTNALSAARQAHRAAAQALALAEAAAGLAGTSSEPAVLDEMTVKRINVVEDDGTLRIVIGNSTHGRSLPVRGRLVPHPGRAASAGILFVNDEGTECGALQYAGARGSNGKEQMGFLSVDDYEQNEGLSFGMVQNGSRIEKFLEFADQPEWSIADLVDETEGLDSTEAETVARRYFGDADGGGISRMRLARDQDASVRLVLRDGQGRDRIRLVVPADGEPVVEVIDADGVARSLL
jgi:hypothetical protein